MPVPVYHGERLRRALTAPLSLTGNAGRVHFAFVGDSNQFQTPSDDATYRVGGFSGSGWGGHWEGFNEAMYELFGCYGGPVGGMHSNGTSYTDRNHLLFSMSNADSTHYVKTINAGFPSAVKATEVGQTPLVTDRSPTLASASIDNNVNERFVFVPHGFFSGTKSKGSTTIGLSCDDPALAHMGNINTSGHRAVFRYHVSSGGRFSVRVCNGFSSAGLAEFSTNTPTTGFVTGDFAVNPGGGTSYRPFCLAGASPSGQDTVGPVAIGGIQYVRNDVAADAGAGGIAVTPWFGQGGKTLTDFLDSIFACADPVAVIAEYIEAFCMRADHLVIMQNMLGNDVSVSTHASRKPDGTTGADTGGSGTHPDGWQQSLATFVDLIGRAFVATGRPKKNLTIVQAFYHLQSGTATKNALYEEAARDLSDGVLRTGVIGTSFYDRLVVVNSAAIAGVDDMTATFTRQGATMTGNDYYAGVDTAHLKCIAYRRLQQLQAKALVAAAGVEGADIPTGSRNINRLSATGGR